MVSLNNLRSLMYGRQIVLQYPCSLIRVWCKKVSQCGPFLISEIILALFYMKMY
jgi:hypothetical protein